MKQFCTAVLLLFTLTLYIARPAPAAEPAPSRQAVEKVDDLKLLPGFAAELIYTVPKEAEGSWVSMTVGPKGRLIVSDQYGALYRVTPGYSAVETTVERLRTKLGKAHGLLYTFDSLYLVGAGEKGTGLYRLRDTTGDEQFDQTEFLAGFAVGGEHQGHAVVRGPDDLLYVVCGNMTNLPADVAEVTPRQNYQFDWLLPTHGPPSGHNRGGKPLAGFVARTDKDGKSWQHICGGFRNSYDIVFNDQGELFAYDSDMEYDSGTPWYRPTRLNHCISGAEFGWRRGAGKWPDYYADSFGSVIDIGQGCPTGVVIGYGAKFPAKYQQAIYLNDWTYGRIRAIHLKPQGASYTATAEDFVVGKPLPLTDSVIGADGAMYFLVGGRKTQSKLFRLTYQGEESTEPYKPVVNKRAAAARALRHKLEVYHTKRDKAAIDVAWPYLNSPDRAIRNAARIAIEHQDVALWQQRALDERRPQAAITAMVALARWGDAEHQPQALACLGRLDLATLPVEQVTEALRAYALVFIRLGQPSPEVAAQLAEKLDAIFPYDDVAVDHELARLLVYLGSKNVVSKSVALMRKSRLQEDQMFYANVLRLVKTGWSIEDRKEYFTWINKARYRLQGGDPFDAGGYFRYSGGRSFRPYVNLIRQEALATFTDAEKKNQELMAIVNAKEPPPKKAEYVLELKGQPNVWQVNDLVPVLSQVKRGRSFKIGKAAFEAVSCAKCHKFGDYVGNLNLGPELTKVASRYSPKDLLESIIEPSKVISDQHAQHYVITDSGLVYHGKLVSETDSLVEIQPDPNRPATVTIPKVEIEERGLSKISRMPNDLLNPLTQEQILDLVAYILSGGDPDDPAFAAAGGK